MKAICTAVLLFTLRPIFINGDSSIKVTLKTQNISSETSVSSSFASVYYGEMALGTPEQSFNFTFDTTSDLIWVPGINCTFCVNMTKFNGSASTTIEGPSGSGKAKLNLFGNVTYTLFSDVLTVSKGLNVTKQTFGFVNSMSNPTSNGISGFAGLGPGNSSFVTNVLNKKKLSSVFSLTIQSSPKDNKQAGEIIFGGVTSEKSIVTIPSLSETQWTFEIQNISVGNKIIPCTSCNAQISILDNPYITGANATIQAIYKAIGANSTGYVTKSDNLTSVSFTIGSKSFDLMPDDYLHKCVNGTCSTAFIVGTSQNETQLVLGTVFVSKYRWIFNMTSKHITIANGSSSALQPALIILTSLVAWACLRQEPFQSIMH